MRSATRFAIAVHILALIGIEHGQDLSSEAMAQSIGVNPVVVRNITALLRQAGLVHTQQGVVGAHLTRPAHAISLCEIYHAVEHQNDIFTIHANPSNDCSVGAHMQCTLGSIFHEAQQALEAKLAQTSLEQVIQQIHQHQHPS